ncbi:MAG: hypothetical protein ACFWTY_04685 [Shouchella clausii]|jgi:putative intracellular protease/amidase
MNRADRVLSEVVDYVDNLFMLIAGNRALSDTHDPPFIHVLKAFHFFEQCL